MLKFGLGSSEARTAFVIVLSCVVVLSLALFIWAVNRIREIKAQERREARRIFVEEHSRLVLEAQKLAMKWEGSFHKLHREYVVLRHPSSRRKFDTFDARFEMGMSIQKNRAWYVETLKLAFENKRKNEAYLKELNDLLERYSEASVELPTELFSSIEDYWDCEGRVFESLVLTPNVNPLFTIRWSYISPKGRTNLSSSESFSTTDVENMVLNLRAQERKKDFVREERARMSPGLRYDVMKRDGFRCRMCGRSAADGVTLEVDHIIPVSRGGKTEMRNLQTLCWDCNRGKSNKV